MTRPNIATLRGQRGILVASAGGHLAQIARWADRLDIHPDSHFVTFDGPQASSVLSKRNYTEVSYIAPRDVRGIARLARIVNRIMRAHDFDFALSTGAGAALSLPLPCLVHNIPMYYLESVSRSDGPSLTGRVLAKTPWVSTWTQHRSWANRRWKYAGTILDDFQVVSERTAGSGTQKIFVSLGTIRPYRFDALVNAVMRVVEPSDEVVWQLGSTHRTDLTGVTFEVLTNSEFKEYASWADVVVAQAGIGAIIDLLDIGVSPVVVPRRAVRAEHVDDHQTQAARELSKSGHVLYAEVEALTRDHLLQRRTVRSLRDPIDLICKRE